MILIGRLVRSAAASIVGVAAMVVAVGCSSPQPGSPTPQTSSDGLIVAQSAACAARGNAVLDYLTTGNNGGDASLDLRYADSVGVPAPEARALADRAIIDCDADSNTPTVSAATTSDTSTGRVLDKQAAQAGVEKVLSDSYGANVSAVLCPDSIPVFAGATALCTVTIDGANKTVTLTMVDGNGNYEVGLPQ